MSDPLLDTAVYHACRRPRSALGTTLSSRHLSSLAEANEVEEDTDPVRSWVPGPNAGASLATTPRGGRQPPVRFPTRPSFHPEKGLERGVNVARRDLERRRS
jgi:hypothetical protein